MRDFSSFEKKNNSLAMTKEAASALHEVARRTRHYKKYTSVALFGKDGRFIKAGEVNVGASLTDDPEKILALANEYVPSANCIMFAHGHLKGEILDRSDVCFDYRLLSSVDITNLMRCQAVVGSDVQIYTTCLSCDDLGNVTMQIMSSDGKQCYQHTNLQVEGSGKLTNNSFEELVELERLNVKY